MVTLYQYCDKCKTQRNFDVKTIRCKKCNHKNKSYEGNKKPTP